MLALRNATIFIKFLVALESVIRFAPLSMIIPDFRDGWHAAMRLARAYSEARTQAAAERALLTGACRCRSVESILKNSLCAAMRCNWTTQTSDWKRRTSDGFSSAARTRPDNGLACCSIHHHALLAAPLRFLTSLESLSLYGCMAAAARRTLGKIARSPLPPPTMKTALPTRELLAWHRAEAFRVFPRSKSLVCSQMRAGALLDDVRWSLHVHGGYTKCTPSQRNPRVFTVAPPLDRVLRFAARALATVILRGTVGCACV